MKEFMQASGIGLSTVRLLLSNGWKVAIVDVSSAGEQICHDIKADFYKANVGEYSSLAKVFQQVWDNHAVFANAGIVKKLDFYEELNTDVTPAIDMSVIEINLKSVISTSHLALHFLRKNKLSGGNPIITSSCGGIYPIIYLPMYPSAKHGCVGLTRSLAKPAFKLGIRVNCICPALDEWDEFGQDHTPVENVARVVGDIVEDESYVGQVVEIVQDKHFRRPPPEHWDPAMERVIKRTEAMSKL
ncbi:15-hydroxyprostaglandin dehydrogenase [Penicillium malachiteum]|nr:15-hydroxyprostaglandin dehydrogenase [Penicillium malachiteum]